MITFAFRDGSRFPLPAQHTTIFARLNRAFGLLDGSAALDPGGASQLLELWEMGAPGFPAGSSETRGELCVTGLRKFLHRGARNVLLLHRLTPFPGLKCPTILRRGKILPACRVPGFNPNLRLEFQSRFFVDSFFFRLNFERIPRDHLGGPSDAQAR